MNNFLTIFAFFFAFPHIFFSSVDPLEWIKLPLQCFWNSLHDWNIRTEFIFCPKQRVVYVKVFLTYNINKVYLQCKLSDAKGWDVMKGFAIFIAFSRFFPGMSFLMYVRCQWSHVSNAASCLYTFSTVSLLCLWSNTKCLTYQDASEICLFRLEPCLPGWNTDKSPPQSEEFYLSSWQVYLRYIL